MEPAPLALVWLGSKTGDGRWICSTEHPELQRPLQTQSIQHNPLRHLLNFRAVFGRWENWASPEYFLWMGMQNAGCAVQGQNPKWVWLLDLCAFNSCYFSEKNLHLPLLIFFCFTTSSEGEGLSFFSLWAWGHKNRSLPPLALGPKADCQWWPLGMGNIWCAWFNGACEVHKAWSTTGNHQLLLPTQTSTVSDFVVSEIIFSALSEKIINLICPAISNSLPLLEWKIYLALSFKISKFPLQSSVTFTGPATSCGFQNRTVYCI